MKLIAFSVEKYRSIISKSELRVGDYTAIIGPNNKGKSNLLRGLMVALGTLQSMSARYIRLEKRNGRLKCKLSEMYDPEYDWERDFPMSLQHDKRGRRCNKKSTIITDFLLEGTEHSEFKKVAGFGLGKKKVSVRVEFGVADISFSLKLQGRAFASLTTSVMRDIAHFLMSRINVCYIDAERTAGTATRSISRMVEMPIRRQLKSRQNQKFLKMISEKQSAILENVSRDLEASLKEFLPAIKHATIVVGEPNIYSGDPDIRINDGAETSLAQKGSGIQSLTALSIARYVSESGKKSESDFVLAIEEPETHLHPDAIHQVRRTMARIALKTPVIVTTHSPLLVNLSDIGANIIVEDNGARSAKSIAEIRDVLGVLRFDNLTNAEVVIVVEGKSDQRILETLLGARSRTIKNAISNGTLLIRNAQGCSKIPFLKRLLDADMCKCHIVLDADSSGEATYKGLLQEGVSARDVTLIKGKLSGESEIEDTLNEEIYWDALAKKFALKKFPLPGKVKGRKWSERMRMIYGHVGGGWNESVENEFKTVVADAVVKAPDVAVLPGCDDVYQALATRIEAMLDEV